MKYLKRYNESFGTELEEVQWCKDALQDLEDSGYKVSIRTYPVYGVSNPGISITIDSNTGKLLPITIGEYLLTLHSYLLENGYVGFRPYDYDNPYSLSRHQVTVNAQLKGVRNQFENELSQFVKMLDRFQVNAPFDSVSVSYYKPDASLKESIDINVKSDIEDIALELTDCEIYYEIADRKYWKDGVTSEEALIIYLRDNQKRFFYIKDIEDVLLRLKDYIKMTDYSIDLSIPDSDDYLTFDEFIKEFSGEELYHVNIIIYYNPRKSTFQRKYTPFEDFHESVNESVELDLKDILLDLQDMGYRVIHEDDVLYAVTGEPSDVKAIVVSDVMKPSDWVELPWSELKDYALRIKDYLGDKYLDFSYRSIFAGEESKLYKKVELNEMTEIDDRIWSFAIKYKE